ncbi:hypothetical protein B0I72DRAFT_128344 [Yarrowia lipolytica]|jgi:hypothetical protein|uniref:YALI0D21406p n=3 Tax=Yarrowia lipolytica TaxID=4952 RepID=Q6C8A2_YARLI|nr:YALI0D21406p [Yarrowia lipolytica CLIB122]KAB8285766.1 hypothetical protein BKA91DRAFT_143788 [Yarrowia lipolytica]KAE8169609.1 hypothetical protein BKA90DRAFT_131404 [Yarrowia lipolytica]KAJ8054108.1 hypothetical protein LXG23DRAFT_55676 [Yarrowia lipolytica]QNP98274.1 Hypothetical protein YALI2_D00715g [Yarrowia lipolytica]RDW24214.1 hypothetical protein B0I71DRAFT_154543 [Yarrowia lipolytica]|eukprot:XP_503110.1 YALI0D21406p [Yarrowia lipolytica CLIB122]
MPLTLEDIRKVYERIYFDVGETKRLHLFLDLKLTSYLYHAVALEDTKTEELIDYPDARLSEQEQLVEYHECEGDALLVKFPTENRFLTQENEKELNSENISDAVFECLKTRLRKREPQLTAAAKIRRGGDFDFHIISKEGTAIGVHSVVLSAVWPFFKALMDSNMQETANRRLLLSYPHEWVEALVSYLYEEEQQMGFELASGVLVLSSVYDLPELTAMARTRVLKEPLDTVKSLLGWRNAYEARCEEVQLHMARFLAGHRHELHSSGALEELSLEEVDQLEEDLRVEEETLRA